MHAWIYHHFSCIGGQKSDRESCVNFFILTRNILLYDKIDQRCDEYLDYILSPCEPRAQVLHS